MRLTNAQRDQVITKEANNKFDAIIKKQKEKLLSVIEKYVKKALVNKKLPQELINEGYIRTTDQVSVKFRDKPEGYQRTTYSDRETFSMNEHLPLKTHASFSFDATIDMQKEMDALIKLRSDKKEFTAKLKTILYSLSNDKQIEEHLPELKKYFKKETKTMAMIPIEQINSMREMLKAPAQLH